MFEIEVFGITFFGNTFFGVRNVVVEDGIGALYSGVTPKIVRAIVSGALQFSVLEGVKDSVNGVLLQGPSLPSKTS